MICWMLKAMQLFWENDQAGKQTWIALRGVNGTKADLERTTDEAISALHIFGTSGNFFKDLALKMLHRVQ